MGGERGEVKNRRGKRGSEKWKGKEWKRKIRGERGEEKNRSGMRRSEK